MPAFRGVKNEICKRSRQIQVTFALAARWRSSDKPACTPYSVSSQPQIPHFAGPWFAEKGRSKVQFVDVTAPPVRPRFPIEGDPETQGDNSCPLGLAVPIDLLRLRN